MAELAHPGPGLVGNTAYLYGTGMVLILVGILLACYLVIKAAWRRRESQRRSPRYQFDDLGRIVGREAPPRPHQFCTALVCFDPERRTHCTHGRSPDE